ncbi:restriction endonuclease subunit S [Metabacillus niabensis]|uniref:restriction endonuclease subunit S n=1 Tax=Metabacillus niabensis TaxID=324854 RepID=UPI0039A1C684
MKHTYTDLREFVPQGWKVAPLRWYLSCKSGESIETNFVEKIPTDESNIPVIGGNGVMGYSNQINVNFETISIGRVGALCGNTHYINYPTWITDNSLLINRYNKAEINLEFLKFVLEQLNLNQYSTSTAQPLITGETIKKRKIALPSVDNQKKIVNYIYRKTSEIDELVNSKQKLINLLENQRQSIITEAVTKGLNPNVKMKDSGVDWIGEIPDHWEISKIKYQADINKNTLAENTDSLYEMQYIDIGSVNSKGELSTLEKYRFSDAPSRARRKVKKGDTIVSTVRTYLKAISTIESEDENLVCSTGFAVLTARKTIREKYLSYLFKSTIYVDEIVSRSTGVSYPAINASEIGNLECLLPSLEEQKEIEIYIEKRLLEIDKLIKIIIKQIEKLKEYRQSLIYEAVTGKIDVRELELD